MTAEWVLAIGMLSILIGGVLMTIGATGWGFTALLVGAICTCLLVAGRR